MQQSSVIFANLFVAYLLFIVMKGELGTYINLLKGGGQEAGTATTSTAIGNAVQSGANQLLNENPIDTPIVSGTNNAAYTVGLPDLGSFGGG